MTLQTQIIGPSRPTALKKIPFVLPGRRTLSEHLPAEVIDVPITVAQRSRYLRKAIVQQVLKDPTKRQIRVPGVDSIGFEMYVEWLQSGRVESHTPTSTSSNGGVLLRDSFHLIFAHIAGSQLEEPDFQDHIIDTLAKLLDPLQTPDLKVLEVVFLEKGASNILKQFVVDRMFAIERKMLGMIRGSADDLRNAFSCDYHMHEPGACYRNDIKDENTNEVDVASQSHRFSTSSMDSLHKVSHPLRSLSTGSPHALHPVDTTLCNMTEKSYFGSPDWFREVHGLAQRTRTPGLRTNKPLPTVPPLTPGTLPSPPSSPHSLHFLELPNTESKVMITQDIVQECLQRLQGIDVSEAATSRSPDPIRSDIPVLVLECLERFKKSSTENAPDSSLESSLPSETLSPDSPISLQRQTTTSPDSDSEITPISHQAVHWEGSFDLLPKPLLPQTQTKPPASATPLAHRSESSPHPFHIAFSQSFPVMPARTPIVARKPVPLRGEDWLKQYDSVNAMMNNTPVLVAKRSKKSRFKEMLRRDSRMSRIELDRW